MTFKAAVLSIDGGGIKGIVPAMILAEIEEKTGRSICELFDFIAGTSTGGILALGLTVPSKEDKNKALFTANELANLYRKKGEIIFQRRKHEKIFDSAKFKILQPLLSLLAPGVEATDLFNSRHSREGKKSIIKDYFGNTDIEEALTEVLITSYATNLRKPIFFTSNPEKEQAYRRSQSFRMICKGYKMMEAALATSAAPTYFKPYYIPPGNRDPQGYTLVDGGVFVNNPTSIAIIEAMNSYKSKTGDNISLHDLLVVSIGTGKKLRGFDINDIVNWGQIKWIEPLIDISLNGQTEVVDYQMEQLLSMNNYNQQTISQGQKQYYRFQVQYSPQKKSNYMDLSQDQDSLIYVNDRMDDASSDNISSLVKAAGRFIDIERHNIENLIAQLQSNIQKSNLPK